MDLKHGCSCLRIQWHGSVRATVTLPLQSELHACCLVVQDEFKFYMKDASSKLLLVPVKGNREAEKAASSLNMPVASVALSQTGGERLPPQILLLPGHDCADCSLIRASGR